MLRSPPPSLARRTSVPKLTRCEVASGPEGSTILPPAGFLRRGTRKGSDVRARRHRWRTSQSSPGAVRKAPDSGAQTKGAAPPRITPRKKPASKIDQRQSPLVANLGPFLSWISATPGPTRLGPCGRAVGNNPCQPLPALDRREQGEKAAATGAAARFRGQFPYLEAVRTAAGCPCRLLAGLGRVGVNLSADPSPHPRPPARLNPREGFRPRTICEESEIPGAFATQAPGISCLGPRKGAATACLRSRESDRYRRGRERSIGQLLLRGNRTWPIRT